MAKVNNDFENYLEQHTSHEDEVLNELARHTYLTTYNPRMISGIVQGKFLELLCKIYQPKRILEIGTFTGYSTICMAKGIGESSIIDTIEVNDELETTILEYLQKAHINHKVKLHIGNALEIIPQLSNDYDLIFIDGDKREYPEYFKLVIDKVKKGGLILADNVLWSGKVLDSNETDKHTIAVKEFNNMVQNHPSIQNVLLPLRDGLMLMYKTE